MTSRQQTCSYHHFETEHHRPFKIQVGDPQDVILGRHLVWSPCAEGVLIRNPLVVLRISEAEHTEELFEAIYLVSLDHGQTDV
jgi:hypothetical protein